jgi:hypothetical protein
MRQDARMSKPYIMVGRKSNKGFNTTTVSCESKCGAKCLPSRLFKASVNATRINREMMRHKLAVASFVSAPRLVKQ